MKGKKLSTYTAALVITLIGAGAVLLLINAGQSVEEPAYADLNPADLNADFGTE